MFKLGCWLQHHASEVRCSTDVLAPGLGSCRLQALQGHAYS